MTTEDYGQQLNALAQKGNWNPVGETIWNRSKDRGLYIGSKKTAKGEVPTYSRKLVDGRLFVAIQDSVNNPKRGNEAGIQYKPDDIYKALHKSIHDVFNVYSSDYAEHLANGKTKSEIDEIQRNRGQGAATLSSETFATLRNTNTQLQIIKIIDRPTHILTHLMKRTTVDTLEPVKFGEFEGSDSISEKVGEFESPQTGLGRYTQHSYTIDKYIGGFNVAPEFFNWDYGQYDIIGDHLRDQVGEIDEIRNKRAYELFTGSGVPTVAATGSYSLLDGDTGWNVNNPNKDIRPIVYTMNTSGRGQRANFALMNANLLTTIETNTYLGPNPNPNDTGRAFQPTEGPEDNTILPAGTIVGLRNLRVAIDNMMTDNNGIVIGSDQASIFTEGPSSSRSFIEQHSEVLMRQNKWWFGVYLYDATYLRRITGGA